MNFYYLDWDQDLINLCQGYGHIISMINLLFLNIKPIKKKEIKEKGRDRNNQEKK